MPRLTSFIGWSPCEHRPGQAARNNLRKRMYALDCSSGSLADAPGSDSTKQWCRGRARSVRQEEEHGMRNRLRLPALAITGVLLLAACTSGASPGRRRLGSAVRECGRGADAGAGEGLRAEHRRERDADVGALRRQQGHGRPARLRLERRECRQADQPELHPPRRDGRQDRPGHRLRRRAGPDGHGPDLRAAVRERRPARRPDRQDRRLDRARHGEPRSHDRGDVQRQALRRPAVRGRVGAVLQQGPLRAGRPRSGQAADQPGGAPRVRRQDHRARRRHQGLLPAGQLRRLQHLHRRSADVGLGAPRSRPGSAATSR